MTSSLEEATAYHYASCVLCGESEEIGTDGHDQPEATRVNGT